jgi:hypothetical protein
MRILPPTIRRHAAVNSFDKAALARQQLHFAASENAFGNRQVFEKREDPTDA